MAGRQTATPPPLPGPAPVMMPPVAPAGSLGGAAPVAPQQQAELAFTAPNPGTVSVGQFGDKAPTATPYGDFTAPDPTKMAADPYYQFRMAEGLKARQRGAAARGTLLNGGTLKALEGYSQGLASEEGQHIYDRALTGYTTNRETNAQNFGQRMGEFQGNLGAFNANTGATIGAFNANTAATLGGGRLGLDAATASYDRARDAAGDQQGYEQASADQAYAQHVAQAREQAAQAAMSTVNMQAAAPTRSPFARRWPMR